MRQWNLGSNIVYKQCVYKFGRFKTFKKLNNQVNVNPQLLEDHERKCSMECLSVLPIGVPKFQNSNLRHDGSRR